MIPQEKRLKEDFNWLTKNMKNIQQRKGSAGKFIAVINKEVAGIGKTATEAYEKSQKLYPDQEPLMDVVPFRNHFFSL